MRDCIQQNLDCITKDENVDKLTEILSFYVGMITLTFVLISCWIIPNFLVSVWMERFISVCRERKNVHKVEHAKYCLGLYNEIERGFGYFFFHVFVVTQFLSIFMLFLAISRIMELDEFVLAKLLPSIGMIIITAGLIFNIVAVTITLDNVFKNMKEIKHVLQDELEKQTEVLERQRIQNVIQNIRDTGPLTGKGLFEITRGTLTSMVSVGITYIIIIVQFKMSLA